MYRFGIWAPLADAMRLRWRDHDLPLNGPNARGWWTLDVGDAQPGDRYGFLIDSDETLFPDPRSQRQPEGVHSASQIVDHSAFEWHDQLWRGAPKVGSLLYELHIGTFSQEGTFDGAISHLQYLRDLGVTHVEVMPIAAWGGDRGWGYDGVALFAPHESYGGPDGFKRFVDACHGHGLSVILDVVYNHFGPVGNYATKFGPYLNPDRKTPWGDAVNLDGEGSDDVRRFFVDNALMWLRDYHCDGLRLDAVHAFLDLSATHILEQITVEVERLSATIGKEFLLIAESDLNDPRVVRSREAHGCGMDAQWNDDFHHSLFSLLYQPADGESGYYGDFGAISDLHMAMKNAFVYDGRYSAYRKRTHGRPINGLPSHHFVHFDQNHDQIGNRANGERLEHLVGVDASKIAIALVLLGPQLPMLFMGEEWAASSPFLYFADHEDEELRRLVADGRKREFAAFGFEGDVPNPEEEGTFIRSKLVWEEQGGGKHADMLEWTRSLIQLRRSSVCFNDGDPNHLHGYTDEERKILVVEREEARILVNFGTELQTFSLLNGETLRLASRSDLEVVDGQLHLRPMTIAVLMASSEDYENRKVQHRQN